MTQGIAERIRECADMAGSGDELARISAIPRRTLESYLTGDSEPKVSRALAIADAVGASLDWLIAGRGPKVAGGVQPHQQAEVPSESEYAFVPLYDARCSAGHGAWTETAKVLTRLVFTRYSLRKKGLDPAHLAALRNGGDSMWPILKDGDTILIDLRQTTPSHEGIYVLRLDDFLYAKRLQRQFDGSLHIISENKAYKDMVVPKERLDELVVIGRAVWSGGWLI